MAASRPSWNGAILFGDLRFPIQLLPATTDHEGLLRSVHAKCLGGLKQLRVCGHCTAPVIAGDVTHAIDIGAGKMVGVTAEEIAALAPLSRKLVKIEQCPPASALKLEQHEATYYVMPDGDEGLQAFNIFRCALETTGASAIGKISFRSREVVAAFVAEQDGALRLHVLRWPEEIRTAVYAPRLEVTRGDLAAADRLIEAINANARITNRNRPDFTRFVDEFTKRLKAVIDRKRGQEIPAPAAPSSTLKKSVAKIRRSTARQDKAA